MITTEAKFRILFRLARAAAEFIPGAQIPKVLVETAVDVVDEYRKGIVYTVEKAAVQETPTDAPISESVPDLSLSVICRELHFDLISFPACEFKTLLSISSTIELEDCVIASDDKEISLHLNTLPNLRGRGQFIDARMIIMSDKAVIHIPAASIRDESDATSNVVEVRYAEPRRYTVDNTWEVVVSPSHSLSSAICARLTVADLKCTAFTFASLSRSALRFAVCVVRS
jgi:hypothetical protein